VPAYSLPQRALASVIVAAIAGVLLYLGVPRTVAAVKALPGNEILRQVLRGHVVPATAVEQLIATREATVVWTDRGRDWTDLGLAQLLLANLRARGEVMDQVLLKQSIASLEEGLAMAPLSPTAWLRLAYARSVMDGPSPAVADALRMSILTGPHEPELAFLRLRLCLLAWDHLSDDDRVLVRRQIRFAWQVSRRSLVTLAEESTRLREIRLGLLEDPDALAEFERMLRGLRERKSRERATQ